MLSEWRPASTAKKARTAPRIIQHVPYISWFIYSSGSLSNKYVVVMILQTQSRSSSEKGYIADTRPRNFDASITAASPCKSRHSSKGEFQNGQTPKSDIQPNIAPKIVTPENYLQIWDSSATLIGQLATVNIFGAMLGGIPLSGPYPFVKMPYLEFQL